MAYTAGNLTLLRENVFQYVAGDDGIATVNTAGYFNNTDDQLPLAAGDTIVCICSDGNVMLQVDSVSSGSVTTKVFDALMAVETGATTANFPAFGVTQFGATSAKSYTIDTPIKGAMKVLFCTAGATGALQTVNTGSTGITWNGTADDAVFNGAGDALWVVGASATRWLVVANTGTVAFS